LQILEKDFLRHHTYTFRNYQNNIDFITIDESRDMSFRWIKMQIPVAFLLLPSEYGWEREQGQPPAPPRILY
jgi:hypothetical protein